MKQDSIELLTGSNIKKGADVVYSTSWVNFIGTGIISITDSHNVSSLTDFGVGKYGVNFATAMNNTDYSVTGSGTDSGAGEGGFGAPSTGVNAPSKTVNTIFFGAFIYHGGFYQDWPEVNIVTYGGI